MSEKKIEIETIRHSLSHILASAVMEMFPDAKLGIGPAIENGFYYDFDLPRTLTPEDLPKLEKSMREIIAKNLAFERRESSDNEISQRLKDQPYKKELTDELKDAGEEPSYYITGSFVDLCKGPHVRSTEDLIAVGFKLDKIAGAYWKGSEKNKMLQRIYGIAFETKDQLKKYEEMMWASS